MTSYDRVMSVERLTVSFSSDLAADVRTAALDDDQNVSAWLADAARRRLNRRALSDVISEWEGIHGSLTPEEVDDARRWITG